MGELPEVVLGFIRIAVGNPSCSPAANLDGTLYYVRDGHRMRVLDDAVIE